MGEKTKWELGVIDENQGDSVHKVLAERDRQDAQWGKQHHTPEVWLAILMEEVGEFSKAVLHGKFGGEKEDDRGKEIIQIAAVALAMIEDGI